LSKNSTEIEHMEQKSPARIIIKKNSEGCDQGCQIFLGTTYQNGWKYKYKWLGQKNQMAQKYIKRP
jgi:hypothetical protein